MNMVKRDLDKVLNVIDELTRKSEKVLPQPCDGELYDDWNEMDYVAKLMEEVSEVAKATADVMHSDGYNKRIMLLAELTDVIVIATSYADALGFDEDDRQDMMISINESNATRDGGRRIRQEDDEE